MAKGESIHHPIVRRAIRHIRDKKNGRATLAEISRAAGASPFHLDRVLMKQTGKSAGLLSREVLLERAAVALRTTPKSIAMIAFDCGYANAESFSRAFRKQWQLSPREYRRKNHSPRKINHMKDLKPEVNLIKIPVTDFARSRAFYRDILGLEEEFAVEEYGWAQFKAGALPICLYVVGKGGGDGRPGNEVNFHLSVSDLKAASKLLESRGMKFACPLTASDDGGNFFIIADPDGNRIKIVQRV